MYFGFLEIVEMGIVGWYEYMRLRTLEFEEDTVVRKSVVCCLVFFWYKFF